MLKVKLTSRGKGKKKKGMLKPRPAGQQRSIKLRLLRKRKTTNKKVFPLRRGLGGSTGSRSSSTNAMLHHHISPRSDKQSTDSRGAFCTFHVIIGQRRVKDETRVVSVCSSCCKSTSLVWYPSHVCVVFISMKPQPASLAWKNLKWGKS